MAMTNMARVRPFSRFETIKSLNGSRENSLFAEEEFFLLARRNGRAAFQSLRAGKKFGKGGAESGWDLSASQYGPGANMGEGERLADFFHQQQGLGRGNVRWIELAERSGGGFQQHHHAAAEEGGAGGKFAPGETILVFKPDLERGPFRHAGGSVGSDYRYPRPALLVQ